MAAIVVIIVCLMLSGLMSLALQVNFWVALLSIAAIVTVGALITWALRG